MTALVAAYLYPREEQAGYAWFVKARAKSPRQNGIEIAIYYIKSYKSKWRYLLGCFSNFIKSMTNTYDVIHIHYETAGLFARCQSRILFVVPDLGGDFYGQRHTAGSRSEKPHQEKAGSSHVPWE